MLQGGGFGGGLPNIPGGTGTGGGGAGGGSAVEVPLHLDNRAGASVDGVFIFGGALPEVHVVFQAAIVVIPLHHQAADLGFG